jgi:hypothetical protein
VCLHSATRSMRLLKLRSRFTPDEDGQSLVESALVIPLFLLIVFNAVNFGYFFFIAINLASAPREGVEYSIQGSATPATPSLPAATAVRDLTYSDMVGLAGSSGATVQVCTMLQGLAAPGRSNCTTYPSGTGPTPDADPEPSSFVLHRVDVTYTVSPLIPTSLNLFGVSLTPGSLTFHRQVSMRAMN